MPRKKPYSGKQKKKQLQDKRNRREGSSTRSQSRDRWGSQKFNESKLEESRYDSDSSSSNDAMETHKANVARNIAPVNPRERYRLNFLKESRDEIERRKHQSQTEILRSVGLDEMECSIEEIFQPGSELDMPRRPQWKYGDSKQKVEKQEELYFTQYLDVIYQKFQDRHLSYFEHNLETWRQLWRVLEMSDVIAMVTDVRHPVLHFSPALYNFAAGKSGKSIILILNKIDLVPAPVVVAWKRYFENKFPKLHIITFTSFPKNVRGVPTDKRVSKRRAVGKRVYSTQIGPQELLGVCREICGEKVDLSSWEQKIKDDLEKLMSDSDFVMENEDVVNKDHGDAQSSMTDERFKNGKLTLGFVGHPNVGKSSLMNGLIGKKVVSTSVTPGHTKYFQTYFLTPTVMLCDCPGLVFPSLVSKQMQILSGIYPISQVQEPYTPVGYLASRIPIVKLLGITHPEQNSEWTAWNICEAWAEKRGFFSAKGGRTDVYRAANNILRMAVDGRLCLFMLPPNYTKEEERWIQDPETTRLLNSTFDPNLMTFHESFHDKELASTDRDSTESSGDNESSNERGDGMVSVQNKFSSLLGEE